MEQRSDRLSGRQDAIPAMADIRVLPGPNLKRTKLFVSRGFPKTSVFGKATLNLEEKAAFKPLFPELFPKLTGFWEKLSMLAVLLATGLGGCGNPIGIYDGAIDRDLVAKWHTTQAAADSGESVAFEFTWDGTWNTARFGAGTEITVTTSGRRISATVTADGQSTDGGSANYAVTGTTLSFSNFRGTPNYFSMLKDATGTGTYYRKADGSGAGGNDGNGNDDTGGGDSANPFLGTWTGEGLILTVTGSSWEAQETVKGSYTRIGNTAVLSVTHYWEYNRWIKQEEELPPYTATVSGNTLTAYIDGESIGLAKKADGGTTVPGDSANPFLGTWTGEGLILTVTGSSWEAQETVKGSYTRTGNTAVLSVTHYWEYNRWIRQEEELPPYPATVSGNTLTAYIDGESIRFVKKTGSRNVFALAFRTGNGGYGF
jgi:hypothetical protein